MTSRETGPVPSYARSMVTTHVLDASTGEPAPGVGVRLAARGGAQLAQASTDTDGRVAALGPERLAPGVYLLTFATGDYFARTGTATFFPEVVLTFEVGPDREDGSPARAHYHVPLLLSPFAYSTYRGS